MSLTLHASASITGDRLVVSTTVANRSGQPVHLHHLLYDWYGLIGPAAHPNRDRPTSALAFACASAVEGELFLLSGDGPPLPAGVNVYLPRTPLSTRLETGAVHTSARVVPLPVREWHGYGPPAASPTVAVAVDRVRYRLDYSTGAAGGRASITATCALPAPVTLLRRTDDFERFATGG